MAKRILFPFGAVLAILLVMAGCGKPEEGMNELTLKQLEEKLENHETFLLLTFAADEKDVKDTRMIEAADDSLRRAGLTGYYTNLKGESDKTIEGLTEKYTHPKAGSWDPSGEGLVLVEKGGITDIGGGIVDEERIKQRKDEKEPFESDYFDGAVKDILEYSQFYNIELTN
ncbi:hypothetical protein [Siminovitchia sp. 179-K 8D1 HS]|uniref:hypothetical protein n=1 Tax=Siminovitchia sp. 179-K 8D1 HS TaxID=3142385 RepID=UPI0039A0D261